MKTIDLVLYSWRNNTTNISYILEFQDLLIQQQKKGDICTCILSNNNSFKVRNQIIQSLEKLNFI